MEALTAQFSLAWQFVLLLVLGLAAARYLLRETAAAASAGSIIMAVGIFELAALQQMVAARGALTQPLALGLLLIWVVIAVSYAKSWKEGRLGEHVGSLIGRFAVGTWVAATAVLLRVILLAFPTWRPLAVLLGLIAFAIWLWFLVLVARGLRIIASRSFEALVPGAVLLTTVSTQALALAAFDVLPEPARWRWLAAAMIGLGLAFYVIGMALVVRSHVVTRAWSLASDWSNTNCIVHGAMSISGLALLLWNLTPAPLLLGLWLYVLLAFVVIEGVELARLRARARKYGWRRAALSYDITQWSRNFTFGMFYALTLALSTRMVFSDAWPWIGLVERVVLTYGPTVILLLLLIETALWLGHRLAPKS